MTQNNLKPGDIILVKDGKSFIAKAIMLSLKIYKRKHGITIKDNFHHAGTIVDLWGVLHVAEANQPGYQIQKLDVAYSEKDWKNRIVAYTPVIPYTPEEQKEINKLAVGYSTPVNRYDFLNFYFQLKLIFSGKWEGTTGPKAEKRFYCSEAVATIANKVRPDTFENPAATNPVDIAINPNFKPVI